MKKVEPASARLRFCNYLMKLSLNVVYRLLVLGVIRIHGLMVERVKRIYRNDCIDV